MFLSVLDHQDTTRTLECLIQVHVRLIVFQMFSSKLKYGHTWIFRFTLYEPFLMNIKVYSEDAF